jgi:glutamate-1-semialdehyde 2,1-aminomutase
MKDLAPLGPVYQAGTLSGNPVAMAAGLATLDVIESEEVYPRLQLLRTRLENALKSAVDLSKLGVSFVRAGSIFWLYLGASEVPTDPVDLKSQSAERYRSLFHSALERGVYLAPSSCEVAFLSAAHDSDAIDQTVEVLAEGLNALPPLTTE